MRPARVRRKASMGAMGMRRVNSSTVAKSMGERREGSWAKFWEECGEKPVEGHGPEDGAEVFVEEPGEMEGEEEDGEADWDGDEKDGEGNEAAAHLGLSLTVKWFFHFRGGTLSSCFLRQQREA